MKKLLIILSLIFSFATSHAQGPGTIYGAVKFMGPLGIPKDTTLPPTANRQVPHVAGVGDSLFLWSWRQQKWIVVIGGGGGGTTYSNGYGLTLASTVFKVDTFAIETRARSLKQLDSLHALATYTNGYGILPLNSNVVAVDTFAVASKPYAKFVGDSIRRLIGIPTIQQVLTAGNSFSQSNTIDLALNSITLSNGGMFFQSNTSGAAAQFSSLSLASSAVTFAMQNNYGYSRFEYIPLSSSAPYIQYSSITFTGPVTRFYIFSDSIQFDPYHGQVNFVSLRTSPFDTTRFKMVVYNPTTGEFDKLPYWPTFGTGSGGTIRAYYVDNIIRSGFDSLFYWRSDTSFAGRGYKLAVNSTKLSLTRPAGENSDSTTSWLLDVNEANLSRNNIGGGALTVANGGTNIASYTKGDILVATGSTTLVKLAVGTDGQVLTADAAQTSGIKWSTPAGGGGSGAYIQNQYTYQTGAAANIKSLTVKDTLWMPGGDSYMVEFSAAGAGSNWINMSTNGASGIGSGGVGQDAWIAYVKFGGQYFPDATAGSIAYRSKTANLYFGVGTGASNSVMQIVNSTATMRITKAGSTIIYDTSAGKPLVVDASGNVIGRGYWYGGTAGGSGTVTTVSVVSANGFAGTVATATTTPAITLTTSITGIIKGNGTALSAATAGTDYEAPHTTLSGYGITDALSNSATSTQDGYFNTINLKDQVSPSHYLTLDVNEDLTAARTLHIVTGDATRTLTFTGNATISGTNTGDQTISLTNDLSGSGTGSISATIASGAVTLAKMANLGNQLLIGRNTAGTGVPEAISISQILDWFSTTQGTILYRGASGWSALAPGTNGNQLTTHGSSANPTWDAPGSGGGGGMTNPMTTLGDIIYEDGTPTAVRLAGNTTSTKKVLTQTGTGSVSAAPAWGTLSGSDVGLGNVENTALSTWAGTSNITTLGTITTGTWSATTIGISKGGTGQTTASAAFDALSPVTTLGDISYRGSSANVRLAGNTTTTKKFLVQTGDGTNSAAPSWGTIAAADIPSGSGNYIQNQSASAQSSSSIYTSGNIKTDGQFTSTSTTGFNFSTVGWGGYGGSYVYFVANSTLSSSGFKFWVNGGSDLGLEIDKDKSFTIPFVGLAADGNKIIAADANGKLFRQTIDPADIPLLSGANTFSNTNTFGSGSATGMTTGSKISVLFDNSANGAQSVSFRTNQTASSTNVTSAFQPWLRTTHSSGTVADVRTMVAVYDQGSANAVTEARVVDAAALMSATTGGTITTLKLFAARVSTNASTATTITNSYGFYYDAQSGSGTITNTNAPYAFYNNDASAQSLLKGKFFLPSLGTPTTDKLTGILTSTGEMANVTIGSGLSLSGNTLSATSTTGNLVIIDDADYTIASGVTNIVYKHMTAGRTITLPSASSNTNRIITITNGGAGSFSITTSASMRQNSSTTTTTVSVTKFVTIMSDGTEWWLVQSN